MLKAALARRQPTAARIRLRHARFMFAIWLGEAFSYYTAERHAQAEVANGAARSALHDMQRRVRSAREPAMRRSRRSRCSPRLFDTAASTAQEVYACDVQRRFARSYPAFALCVPAMVHIKAFVAKEWFKTA